MVAFIVLLVGLVMKSKALDFYKERAAMWNALIEPQVLECQRQNKSEAIVQLKLGAELDVLEVSCKELALHNVPDRVQ